MNEIFIKYKQSQALPWKGKILKPIYNSNNGKFNINLKEEIFEIWGDFSIGVFLLLFCLITIFIDSTYADIASKYVSYILRGIFLILGIATLARSIPKFKSRHFQNFLRINQDGIKHSNGVEAIYRKWPWCEIKEVAIKIFDQEHGYTTYLLFQTTDNKLVDIDISLLKELSSFPFKRNAIKHFFKGRPKYIQLRTVIGNNINKAWQLDNVPRVNIP